MTAVGSQAETIQECIDDERESGRNKPIDIESLLTNVIPTILGQSGDYPPPPPVALLTFYCYRIPLLTRQRIRFRQSIRQAPSTPTRWTVSRRCSSRHRGQRREYTYQGVCCESCSQVGIFTYFLGCLGSYLLVAFASGLTIKRFLRSSRESPKTLDHSSLSHLRIPCRSF